MPAYNNKATFVWDETTGLYKINFPYNKDFVALLKLIAPASDRDYDPASYTWFFPAKYFDILEKAFKQFFPHGYCFKKPESSWNYGNNATAFANKTDQFLQTFAALTEKPLQEIKSLNLSDATKCYRRAAVRYHPDRNPAFAKQMSELNEAWAELKGVYFK